MTEEKTEQCGICEEWFLSGLCTVFGGLGDGPIKMYACIKCTKVIQGRDVLSSDGIYQIVKRLRRLESEREGIVKIKATETVNENVLTELGIPDKKDIITLQGVGPYQDGQWVRRSAYNDLAQESDWRNVQLENAQSEIGHLQITIERMRHEGVEASATPRTKTTGKVIRAGEAVLVKCDSCGNGYSTTLDRLPPIASEVKCKTCGKIMVLDG